MNLTEVFKISKRDISPNINYIRQLTENMFELTEDVDENKSIIHIVEAYPGGIIVLCTRGLMN